MCLIDVGALLFDVGFEALNLLFILVEAVGETLNFVFEVLHFEGQFAAERLDFVDFREFGLKLIEVFELLFHRVVGGGFFLACHIDKVFLLSER